MVLTLAASRAISSVPVTGMVRLSAPAAPTASDRRVTRRVSHRVKPKAMNEWITKPSTSAPKLT